MVKRKTEYTLSPMKKHFAQVIWTQLVREPSPDPRNTGRIHAMTWMFTQEDFPCGGCGRKDTIQFMVLSTGVYRSCKYDGFTERIEPVNYENGQEAILLEDKIVSSNDEALGIIKRYHQEKTYLDPDAPLNLPDYKLPRKAGRSPKKEPKLVPEA
jgi:hypothetical protein